MLFFLSKKYFGSRNCLKEIVASLEQRKPLVLVQEPQEDKMSQEDKMTTR